MQIRQSFKIATFLCHEYQAVYSSKPFECKIVNTFIDQFKDTDSRPQ